MMRCMLLVVVVWAAAVQAVAPSACMSGMCATTKKRPNELSTCSLGTTVSGGWLAVILSFGRPSARRILAVLFQALCSPLKWLDVVLARLPGASNAASALYVEAQKTGPQPG